MLKRVGVEYFQEDNPWKTDFLLDFQPKHQELENKIDRDIEYGKSFETNHD